MSEAPHPPDVPALFAPDGSLLRCPRCERPHPRLAARPFARPPEVRGDCGQCYAGWATCPATGAPVLLTARALAFLQKFTECGGVE